MKRNILLIICLAVAVFASSAYIGAKVEVQPKEYCHVTIMQTIAVTRMGLKNEIVISYPDGTSESVELTNQHLKDLVENGKRIGKVFNDLAKKGYSLKASSGGDAHVTYIFER